MVHREKSSLRRLFLNDEVSEPTYRNIYSKLSLQEEKIEAAQQDSIDPKVYTDRKDIFDRLVLFMLALYNRKAREETLEDRLEYYRAQMIMARKAVETIEKMQTENGFPVFLPQCFERVAARYRQYRDHAAAKMSALVSENPERLTPHLTLLSERSLSSYGAQAMRYLNEKGLVDESMEHNIVETFSPCAKHYKAH
jgi:CPA1 family monovalent cation:H+ antiporter